MQNLLVQLRIRFETFLLRLGINYGTIYFGLLNYRCRLGSGNSSIRKPNSDLKQVGSLLQLHGLQDTREYICSLETHTARLLSLKETMSSDFLNTGSIPDPDPFVLGVKDPDLHLFART